MGPFQGLATSLASLEQLPQLLDGLSEVEPPLEEVLGPKLMMLSAGLASLGMRVSGELLGYLALKSELDKQTHTAAELGALSTDSEKEPPEFRVYTLPGTSSRLCVRGRKRRSSVQRLRSARAR